jgi:hypothetical protein
VEVFDQAAQQSVGGVTFLGGEGRHRFVGDIRGLSVFYAAFGLVLAGYLFGAMTYRMAPRLQYRWRMTGLALFGGLGGAIIALLAGSTGFGALPGPFLGVAAVTGLMAVASGGAMMGFMRLFGSAGLSLASIVLLTLGNATSGGILPAQHLPGWLRPLSEVLPVGAGVRSIQGMAYFHNDGLARGLTVLDLWTVAAAAAFLLHDMRGARRATA